MNDEPWSEQEKTFLLAEILRTSMSSEALMALINQQRIQPNWHEVILPKEEMALVSPPPLAKQKTAEEEASRLISQTGRNMRSCQETFYSLPASPSAFPPAPPPPPPPQPYSRPPELHRKRAFHPDTAPPTTGRILAPKPSTYTHDPTPGPQYTMPSIGEPPPKKKRGRPTKAETEARQHIALASHGPYQPQPSQQIPQSQSLPPPTPQPPAQRPASQPPPSQQQQPPAPPQPSASSSSSSQPPPQAPNTGPFPMHLDAPAGPPGSTASAPPAGGPSAGRQSTPVNSSTDAASETSTSRRKRGRLNRPDPEPRRAAEEGEAPPTTAGSTSSRPGFGSPTLAEARPRSSATRASTATESRGDNIQDRMRVTKFMQEHN